MQVNRRMDTWMTAADILPYRVDSGDVEMDRRIHGQVIEKDKIVDTIVSERFLSETLEQIGGGGSDDSTVVGSD